jgi:hypothetical protein
MPKNVETGKIVWMGLDPQFVVIGRNEVAKVTTGIASSFSCNVCECGSVYVRSDPPGYLPYLSPSSLTVPVGATGSFQVNEYMKDVCSNDPWGPLGPSGSVSWSSSNTAVATVSGQTPVLLSAERGKRYEKANSIDHLVISYSQRLVAGGNQDL